MVRRCCPSRLLTLPDRAVSACGRKQVLMVSEFREFTAMKRSFVRDYGIGFDSPLVMLFLPVGLGTDATDADARLAEISAMYRRVASHG